MPSQAGQRKPVSTRPHHRQAGGPLGPGSPSGPAHAVQRAGSPAVLAGQRGQVAAAWHLDEHRSLRQGLLGGAPGDGGQVGRGDGRVAVGVVALAGDPHRGHGSTHQLARGLDGGELAAGDEVGDGHRAGEARREHPGAADRRPGEQHLAHVRVGRTGLVEQVVAVVPPGDQPEVGHRGEGRGAGAHDHLGVAAQRLEERRVARLRPLVGREPGVPAGAEHLEQGRLDPHDVAVVGHDEHGAAARPRRRPGRPRRAAPASRPPGAPRAPRAATPWAPRPSRGGTGRPGRRRTATRRPAPGSGSGARSGGSVASAFSAAACRGGTASRSTSPSEPAYRSATLRAVASTCGVSTGSGDTTRRTGLSRPGVLGLGAPLEHEAVEVLAGEAHLDPHARHRGLAHRGGHRVLERPVEVRQAGVDLHQRHGQLLGGGVVAREAAGPAQAGTRGEQRELLTGIRAVGAARGRHAPETSGAHRPGRGRWAHAVDDGVVSP